MGSPIIPVEGAVANFSVVTVKKPSNYFVEVQLSQDYFETARNLLIEVMSLYDAVEQWGLIPPAGLS